MRPFLLGEGLLGEGLPGEGHAGDSGPARESSSSDLKRDLGLPILFDAMAAADEFVYGVAESVVLSGAVDVETILYRQAVLGDCLKNRDVVRELYALIGETLAEEKKSSLWFSHQSPSTVLHTAIGALDVLLSALGRIRDILNARSSGFASPGFTALIRTLNVEIDDDFLGYARNHLHDLKFGGGILVGAEMGVGCKGRNYRALKSARKGMAERLRERKDSLILRIPDGDEAGSRALEELRDRGINRVADSLARSRDHVLGFLSSMRFELAFYIGCINLQERLAAIGLGMSLPLPARPEERAHSGKGLYDICLALTLGRPVVGNDLEADGRGLVVVTGANQGGKSTFLRSVGLAQLMMQCGMFVPAENYKANLCASLFTHFRREEDAAMESGKLDEELRRLSGIVDDLRENSMLLFNEPFASTNEREGSEIARRIVGALLERRVKVFFVTHLYDFAATVFKQGEAAALFLRAERREDGTRSYRILAGEPLETSFGKDLYAEVFDPRAPIRR